MLKFYTNLISHLNSPRKKSKYLGIETVGIQYQTGMEKEEKLTGHSGPHVRGKYRAIGHLQRKNQRKSSSSTFSKSRATIFSKTSTPGEDV